ncbi:hypothetical protein BofuT4_uP071540.1 [Botrytis cinerea T4]|uniref:Uncharacterized protein n=1 Tax=Botryotinia fuckeliana (strain T4) TaxID=999810 RepID=G2XPX0_BOTF4|nr:hypothetical protein BofuT4_uP071540.1 [Botrytis cinerea T4]
MKVKSLRLALEISLWIFMFLATMLLVAFWEVKKNNPLSLTLLEPENSSSMTRIQVFWP